MKTASEHFKQNDPGVHKRKDREHALVARTVLFNDNGDSVPHTTRYVPLSDIYHEEMSPAGRKEILLGAVRKLTALGLTGAHVHILSSGEMRVLSYNAFRVIAKMSATISGAWQGDCNLMSAKLSPTSHARPLETVASGGVGIRFMGIINGQGKERGVFLRVLVDTVIKGNGVTWEGRMLLSSEEEKFEAEEVVSFQPSQGKIALKVAGACYGCGVATNKRCSACSVAYFCGTDCQRICLKQHQMHCDNKALGQGNIQTSLHGTALAGLYRGESSASRKALLSLLATLEKESGTKMVFHGRIKSVLRPGAHGTCFTKAEALGEAVFGWTVWENENWVEMEAHAVARIAGTLWEVVRDAEGRPQETYFIEDSSVQGRVKAGSVPGNVMSTVDDVPDLVDCGGNVTE